MPSPQDLDIELAYEKEKRQLSEERAKLVLIFGILLVPLFGGLDLIIARSHFVDFLYLRLLNVLQNVLLLVFLKLKKTASLKTIDAVISIVFISLSILIAYFCRRLGGYESTYYVGIILLFLSIGLVMPWSAKLMLLNCLFSIVLYTLIAYTPSSTGLSYVNNSYFLITNGFMTVVGAYYSEKLRRRDFMSRFQLKEANQQLLSLDQAKTRFFANLTHEFRTPLVANSTLLQAIKEKIPLTPELKDLLRSATISLDQMLENVNDLLTQTRAEKALLEMRWSKIEIVDLIRKTVKVLQYLADKQNTRISIFNQMQSATGEKLESLTIYGDRSKLKKVINNLLGNAIKFTQNGQIEIYLNADEEFFKLQIQDNGIGIPPQDLPKIFAPFTQASNNRMRDARGTGLGLSIVQDFVVAHHGRIEVQSDLGKGTCFRVYIPRVDQPIDPAQLDHSEIFEEEMPLEALSAINFNYEPSGLEQLPDRATIVIAEDNAQVAQSLAYILKEDYNLYFAPDGEMGLKLIEELNPELVISDIMMPHKNGYELLAAIKEHPELRRIPVILLTAKVDLPSKVKGLSEGADEYLSKPFNSAEVRARIKNLLSHKKLEAEFIHAEKMIAIGQMTAGISHEILNPIAFASSSADLILSYIEAVQEGKIGEAEAQEKMITAVKRVQEGVQRVHEIAAALRGVVRQGDEGLSYCDIHQGLESTIKIFETNHPNKTTLHREYLLKEKVFCKINQLNQVFLNLLSNAGQALEGQLGNIWIRTFKQEDDAVIEIQDDGPGISKEIQSKIFTPFFTTKSLGQGMGLGLYISRQIVENFCGSLSVESSPGAGAKFTVRIPLGGENHGVSRTVYDQIDRRVAQVQYPHRG